VDEIGEILFPKAEWLILTEPDNTRALPTSDLADFIPIDFCRDRVVITTSVEDALEKAVELSGPEDVILVTGSLYLVGEAKEVLED